jgi:glycosyltransferase involved in cell wall biosynthesis
VYAEPPEKHFSGELPLKVCTYSRVVESKGIADAAAICKRANELLEDTVFTLEVYGPVAPEYQADFDALCRENAGLMQYCGVKNADEAGQVLQDMFALLFPTYYEGECFAGTALDAFSSRTPILANDWKYNGEVIRDGENGFLYPFRDVEAAAERLARLYREPELYKKIQAGCEESARRYDADTVLEKLAREMA